MPEDVTVLSPKAWDELQKIMDAPPEPTPALVAAAQKYRDEIESGHLISSQCVD